MPKTERQSVNLHMTASDHEPEAKELTDRM
jgi:hypothetical protein